MMHNGVAYAFWEDIKDTIQQINEHLINLFVYLSASIRNEKTAGTIGKRTTFLDKENSLMFRNKRPRKISI